MPSDCIFCRIAAGEADATVIYRDDHSVAFADIAPLEKGHTLVIPKLHVKNIYSLEGETASRVFETTIKVARALKSVLKCDGMTVMQANEPAGGQEVLHFHFHVVPRWSGHRIYGFTLKRERAPREEIEGIFAPVRAALKNP
jgi:histidine triad (HIT) family protein